MVEFVEVFTDWTSVKFTTLSGIYEDLLLKIVNYKKLNLATYWHKQYIETRMLNVNWEGTQIGYRSTFSEFPTKAEDFCKRCRFIAHSIKFELSFTGTGFSFNNTLEENFCNALCEKKAIFMFTPFGNLYTYGAWCNCWFEQYLLARNDLKRRLLQNHP